MITQWKAIHTFYTLSAVASGGGGRMSITPPFISKSLKDVLDANILITLIDNIPLNTYGIGIRERK